MMTAPLLRSLVQRAATQIHSDFYSGQIESLGDIYDFVSFMIRMTESPSRMLYSIWITVVGENQFV